MKKIIIILITPLLFFKAKADEQKPTVSINPAIELVNVIQYLAERTYFTESSYSKAVDEYFKNYKNEAAVLHFKHLLKDGGSWGIGPTIGSRLKWDSQLSNIYPYDEYVIKMFHGKDSLALFIKEIKDFRKNAKFDQFLTQQQSKFDQAKANFNKILNGDIDYLNVYKKYMRIEDKDFEYCISMLTPCGGVAPLSDLDLKNTRLAVFGICDFNSNGFEFNPISIRNLSWHEFNHPEIKPLIENYKDKINESSILFNKISKRLQWSDGISSWRGAVDEHIIRAIVTRIINQTIGKEAAEKELTNQENIYSFEYIRPIYNKLEEYENNPQKYPTFSAFFPELINLFTDIKNNLKVTKIPLTKFRQEKPVVFVLPTNEKGIGRIKIDSIKAETYKIIENTSLYNALIIEDIDALKMEPVYSFYVIGTPEGNLYLKSLLDKIPFKIDENGISGAINQKGQNLSLTAVIPNPNNPEKSIIINTAQNFRDIRYDHFYFGHEYMIYTYKNNKEEFIRGGKFNRDSIGHIIN